MDKPLNCNLIHRMHVEEPLNLIPPTDKLLNRIQTEIMNQLEIMKLFYDVVMG